MCAACTCRTFALTREPSLPCRVQLVHNARRAELDDMLSQMTSKTEQLGALAVHKAKLTQYRAAAAAKVEVR